MLFQFQLHPLNEVTTWSSAGNRPYLHWFGLTDAWYWLHMDAQNELFRYSPEILKNWHQNNPEHFFAHPYVDYQVVRLWEDLLQILPEVLEPLPPPLAQMLETQEQTLSWIDLYYQWTRADLEPGSTLWNTRSSAVRWWENRMLDTGYLIAGPKLWFWNDSQHMHSFWDNRDRYINAIPVWTAQKGEAIFRLPEFIDEVDSFHTRLFSEMDARAQDIKNGRIISEVYVDLSALEKEQKDRYHWLAWSKNRTPEHTGASWDAVIEAIAKMRKLFEAQ